MLNFTYNIPTKIIFGKDELERLPKEILLHGKKVLLLYGKDSIKKTGLYDKVVSLLNNKNISFKELSGVKPNPSISSVREGIKIIRENNLDFILAVGGGSVIDCAKAISAGVAYDGDPWDFLLGKAKVKNTLPIGTILTLAATGSEMNGGSVISNEETKEKLAFGHPLLIPVFTFEDPTLTFTVSKYQTAAGATDIVSHLLEQYFTSHNDEGLPDRLTEAMMVNVINYAKKALLEPDNYDARANLMWTSSLALNNLVTYGKKHGDWASHGIEHEVSAIYDITHGAGLAILFPNVLKYYLDKDIAEGLPLTKFLNLGKNVFNISNNDEKTAAYEAVEKLRTFFNSLDMPSRLIQENVDDSKIEVMAKGAARKETLGYYHTIGEKDVLQILKNSL
jgi:alcohol dehydrogenase YqhD (iron-dependent ADH family)